MVMVRLLLRLMALGCFLLAPAPYLLLALHTHLTCDSAAGTCVLEEKRPLRDAQVRTFPLSDVVDAACQSDAWGASPEAARILKQARRPFNPGESGIWRSVDGSDPEKPRFRVVLLTRSSGIIPLATSFGPDCGQRDAITAVLDHRAAHGELDLGRWWEGLAAAVLPVGMGLALFAWAGRIGRSSAGAATRVA